MRCALQLAGQQLAPAAVAYTVLVNQTAIHGVPTALNAANQALLRAFTGQPSASIRLVNQPLPMVQGEDALVVNQMSGATRHWHTSMPCTGQICLILG